ncbi:DUF6998 domain-containing protein [Bradyrhizobium japonicum]|uniref:DUF6998 domain-containing protein n=1 Tax=Bradyrhizobium japonicum TaxID=375 RepID=UPI0012BB9F73|nr:hypothetical protein [Bradyrhizobium japonicum]
MRINLPKPVTDIYRAVAELEALYPGRKFTPDGHLVGSIGEVIAAVRVRSGREVRAFELDRVS